MDLNLNGKRIIITGASSGIGLEAAKVFAAAGAELIFAVRNLGKAEPVIQQLKETHPETVIHLMQLDVADLASVRKFADQFNKQFSRLDILINNAGVMMPPYTKTVDGFELQFGGNHLGHFALTAHLLPVLEQTDGSRIITIGSLAHERGTIDFDNLDGSAGYRAKKFYNQSKLANMIFALELDRRLKENGYRTISLTCHPGVSATNIFKLGKRDAPLVLRNFANRFLQPPEIGALATVYAAADPDLQGGEYIGPDGWKRRRGYPVIETPKPHALDRETARKLWEVSESLTGTAFPF